MTAYTIIPNTSIDADSLTDVALMTALRDNALAIGEGDATAPNGGVTKLGTSCVLGTPASGDLTNCISNTEAVGTNSTQLATTAFCEAGFVNNDVGVVGIGSVISAMKATSGTIASGATSAGSDLVTTMIGTDGAALLISKSYGTVTGTWRNISNYSTGYIGSINLFAAEFQRTA